MTCGAVCKKKENGEEKPKTHVWSNKSISLHSLIQPHSWVAYWTDRNDNTSPCLNNSQCANIYQQPTWTSFVYLVSEMFPNEQDLLLLKMFLSRNICATDTFTFLMGNFDRLIQWYMEELIMFIKHESVKSLNPLTIALNFPFPLSPHLWLVWICNHWGEGVHDLQNIQFTHLICDDNLLLENALKSHINVNARPFEVLLLGWFLHYWFSLTSNVHHVISFSLQCHYINIYKYFFFNSPNESFSVFSNLCPLVASCSVVC